MVSTSGKKILIVEDEKPLAAALKLKLEGEGLVVEIAPTGTLALQRIKEADYDLIVCDPIMPEMDGFEFLEKATAQKISAPIFVVTNLSQNADKDRIIALGATEFFVKSDTPIADIVENIKKILN